MFEAKARFVEDVEDTFTCPWDEDDALLMRDICTGNIYVETESTAIAISIHDSP